jgi:hypothetical protein
VTTATKICGHAHKLFWTATFEILANTLLGTKLATSSDIEIFPCEPKNMKHNGYFPQDLRKFLSCEADFLQKLPLFEKWSILKCKKLSFYFKLLVNPLLWELL